MEDLRTLVLARNSLLVALGSASISLPVGTLLAVLLWRTDLPWRRGAFAVLAAMLFVPLYLQAAAWDAGFGLQGWFAVRSGGLWHAPLEGWRAVVWIHGLAAIPWVMLIVGAGLALVEPELEEAALLDMPAWQVIGRVTLRRAWPAAGAAGLWVLVWCAGEMTVTDLYRVRTYAEEVYTGFALDGDPNQAALGVLPGMLVVGLLVAAAFLLAQWAAPAAGPATPRAACRFELGAWRWPAAALVALALVLIAGVPLANLCYQAGIQVSLGEAGRVREWSLAKLIGMVAGSPREFRRELFWSAAVGGGAASLSTVLALPLAWLARRRGARGMPAVLAAAVCLAIPGPLVGLGVVQMFHLVDSSLLEWLYSYTPCAPMLAQAIRALPIVLLVCWHGLASIPRELLESAETAGAGPLARFFRVALPLRWGAIAAAWLAGLAVCTGDLAASILTTPPRVSLVSVRVFELVHYGVTDKLAGICLVVAAGSLALAALAFTVWNVRGGE